MSPAPGWYADPQDPSKARYWDGAKWTDQRMASGGTPTTGGGGQQPWLKWLWIGLGVLAVAALAVGAFFLLSGNDEEPDPPTPGESTTAAPVDPSADPADPSADPSAGPVPGETFPADVGVCQGGNGAYTRYAHESFYAAGVEYTHPADWEFSFDPSYFTWLDDHSALGAIKLDGADNEAGIVFGGLRQWGEFEDQRSAAAQSMQCLIESLSDEGEVAAEPATVTETTVGGMPAVQAMASVASDSYPDPLILNVYVIDGGADGSWAELVTFAREGSEAEPILEEAVASVRQS